MEVVSTASSNVGAGSRPGMRRASIVLPAPGGPTRSALCAPAAAISSARLQEAWPRTSERSGRACPGTTTSSDGRGGNAASPLKAPAASARERTPWTSRPWTRAASAPFPSGTMIRAIPRLRASNATGSTPRTGSTSPPSESSPTANVGTFAGGMSPAACRTASAMARSNPAPSFLRSPGARLTVIRLCGSSYPALRIAVAQRTFASTQAMSGSPTTKNPGSPRARSTWTSIGRALAPRSAAHRKEACTPGPHCERRAGKLSERDGAGRPVSNWSAVPERACSAATANEHHPEQRDRGEEGEPPASGVRVPGGDSRARDFREPSKDGGRPPRRPSSGENPRARGGTSAGRESGAFGLRDHAGQLLAARALRRLRLLLLVRPRPFPERVVVRALLGRRERGAAVRAQLGEAAVLRFADGAAVEGLRVRRVLGDLHPAREALLALRTQTLDFGIERGRFRLRGSRAARLEVKESEKSRHRLDRAPRSGPRPRLGPFARASDLLA